jgi:hypothetical protein
MRTLREWLHRLEGTLTRRRRDDDLEEASAMGVTDGAVSPPDFDDWRAHTQAWDGLAASQAGPMLALELGEPVELEPWSTMERSLRIKRVLRRSSNS